MIQILLELMNLKRKNDANLEFQKKNLNLKKNHFLQIKKKI